MDRAWRLKRFNGLASRYFGRAPSEVVGRRLWDLFPAATATPLGRQFISAMETKQSVDDRTASGVVKGKVDAFRLFALSDGLGVAWRDVTNTDAPMHDLGRLAKANDPALEVFRRRDGLYIEGRVRARLPAIDTLLQKMVAHAAREATRGRRYCGHIAISRNSENRPYVAHVSSMTVAEAAKDKPSVLLTISDADRKFSTDTGELVGLFGLTASEARLVGLLSEGIPLALIAKRLEIGFETARTHLARARQKTQTASQIEPRSARVEEFSELR